MKKSTKKELRAMVGDIRRTLVDVQACISEGDWDALVGLADQVEASAVGLAVAASTNYMIATVTK